MRLFLTGEMAEWSNAVVLKPLYRKVPGVRTLSLRSIYRYIIGIINANVWFSSLFGSIVTALAGFLILLIIHYNLEIEVFQVKIYH